MYKFAIVDDEINDLNKISDTINDFIINKDIVITKYHHNIKQVLNQFYHILFLDIDMIEFSGITLAKEYLTIYPQAMIVFITNHHELVYDVFDVRPYAFIQKQSFQQDFNRCLKRLLKILDEQHRIITINNNQILIRDIIYLESNGHYVTIHTKNNTYQIRDKLNNLFITINSNDFSFCHKSYLVNLKFVKEILTNNILLNTSDILPISRRQKESFIGAYQKYIVRRF